MEAILTVGVLSVIFSTLLPVVTHITSNLQEKKFAMHAAETLYHGAITYRSYNQLSGSREVKGVRYDWSLEQDAICVSYRIHEKELVKCIDKDN